MRPFEPLDTGPQGMERRPQNPLSRRATRRRIPAGLLSLILHVSCLLVALWWFRFEQPTGTTLQSERSGELVLVDSRGDQPQYFDVSDSAVSETSRSQQSRQTGTSEPAGSLLVTNDLALPGSLPAADQPLSGSGQAVELPAAAGLLQTGNSRDAGGSGVQTGVFGVKGKGNRFVYVFDRSGSMAGYQGRPLASAKAQLLASLEDLKSTHQFQIVFYANQPSIFNPRSKQTAQMFFADEATKRLAERWVRGVAADGSTQHLDALLLALQMRPDVIFFLTDAAEPRMTSSELEKVNRANQRVGASIHTIEFGAGPGQGENNFLVRLARANAGQYTYVDITRLLRQP